jgi:GntR family transcriptional regulator / MocR family aminotransferase
VLTYSFENIGSEYMYEHIYRCIREDILDGRIKAGEKLPSKRSFAKHLDVSLIVVENAYAQLKAEGYLYSVPKSGYYANSLEEIHVVPSSSSARALEETEAPSYFADFVTSAVESEMFPYAVWTRVMRNVIATEDEKKLLLESPAAGVLKLRMAIANHLYDFRGLAVDPNRIIVGAGTQFLYNILVQLLGREHIYAIEDPGYRRLGRIYESNNVELRPIPLDEYGLIVDALVDSGADIVHVMPSHQFPTGIVMPISRRYELLGWASQRSDRYIIEDDHDCEFRLMGKPIPTLQSVDTLERVIYINTFSRSLAPTFRISYMILPLHLMQRFEQRLGFYSCSVSNFEQFTLAKFIQDGHFERHINRMRSHYRAKRDLLIKELTTTLGSQIKVLKKESGLHFLLRFDAPMSDQYVVAQLKERGVCASCISEYYHEGFQNDSHTIVLNYSGVAREAIPRAVEALADVLMQR